MVLGGCHENGVLAVPCCRAISRVQPRGFDSPALSSIGADAKSDCGCCDGIVDTACIGTLESTIVIADRGGHVHGSVDCGKTWSLLTDGLESPSAVVVL